MKRVWPALITLMFAVALAGAQERAKVGVKAEKEYERDSKIVLVAADFPYKAAQFSWDVEGTGRVDYEESGGKLYVWAAPGKYTVRLDAISWEDKKLAKTKFTFVVKGKADPPKPDPDVPPDPKPDGAVKALRVLIVYETGSAIDVNQDLILRGKAFRDYTKTRGGVDKENPFGPARIWDKDADLTFAPKEWKALMERSRSSVPWIVVEGDGKVRHEGPLPADTKATIDLINKVAPAAVAKRKAG